MLLQLRMPPFSHVYTSPNQVAEEVYQHYGVDTLL
jgi:hypothetical protein